MAVLFTSALNAQTDWRVDFAPHGRHINDAVILNGNTIIIAGGSPTNDSLLAMFKSNDAGYTWDVTLDILGEWIQSLAFSDSYTGIAAAHEGVVLRTTNAGETWTNLTLSGNAALRYNSVWFTDNTTGILAGGLPASDSTQTLLRTTDGGTTWDVLIDETGPILRDVHFSNANDGFAVGEWATVLQTADGGLTWNNTAIPDTINDIRFNNTVIFCIPTSALLRATWVK